MWMLTWWILGPAAASVTYDGPPGCMDGPRLRARIEGWAGSSRPGAPGPDRAETVLATTPIRVECQVPEPESGCSGTYLLTVLVGRDGTWTRHTQCTDAGSAHGRETLAYQYIREGLGHKVRFRPDVGAHLRLGGALQAVAPAGTGPFGAGGVLRAEIGAWPTWGLVQARLEHTVPRLLGRLDHDGVPSGSWESTIVSLEVGAARAPTPGSAVRLDMLANDATHKYPRSRQYPLEF